MGTTVRAARTRLVELATEAAQITGGDWTVSRFPILNEQAGLRGVWFGDVRYESEWHGIRTPPVRRDESYTVEMVIGVHVVAGEAADAEAAAWGLFDEIDGLLARYPSLAGVVLASGQQIFSARLAVNEVSVFPSSLGGGGWAALIETQIEVTARVQ